MSPVVYDPTTPIVPQNHDWDCAEQSTLWALTACGRHPSDTWMENQMLVEHIESTVEGLLNSSGAGLVAFIIEQYGEFGFYANNEPSVTFDAVAAETGPYPLLIGGRAWNHWSGVRNYDVVNDVLRLANPADGWKGVHQTMNRGQWATLGPFSMVRVLHPDLIEPTPAPTFNVGPKILAAMTKNGEVPATNEWENPSGWREAHSNIGRRYTYVISTGQVVVTEGWGA
jgi:hypothetical protein